MVNKCVEPDANIPSSEISEPSLPPKVRERNLGIDLLRILSMFLVTVLHVLGNGGVLGAAHGINYNIAWLMEIMAYCSVNCYALISGYVGVKSGFKYSRIILLWLQVVFYTVGLTVVTAFVNPEAVTAERIFVAFFPVMKREYWYFTAYFCMSFFVPAFNYVVNNMPRRQVRAMIVASLVLLSLLPAVFKTGLLGDPIGDTFWTSNGYNTLWISVLYVIGAYVSKYKCTERIPAWAGVLTYAAVILITWLEKLYAKPSVLVNYTSPTVLIAGFSLLVAFSRLRLRPLRRVIGLLAPAAFGVYVIHVNKFIWDYVLNKRYAEFASYPAPKMVLWVILAALSIYFICSAVDVARAFVFKVTRVREGLERLEKRVFKNLWKN